MDRNVHEKIEDILSIVSNKGMNLTAFVTLDSE
jgi:hypothetical protein